MAEETQDLLIGIPIYDGVDPLDVVAPYEVFSEMASQAARRSPPTKVEVRLLAEDSAMVKTRFGIELLPHRTFAQVERLDVLWVPGGEPRALNVMMKGGPYLDALKRWSHGARLVTSVCEGAMLLAAAGLLDGYHATTHWAFIGCFDRFPQIAPVPLNPYAPDAVWPRFVVDRNRVTGGGISSGLDEALQIVTMLFDEAMAKAVQLNIQYFPDPPVTGAIPAPPSCPL